MRHSFVISFLLLLPGLTLSARQPVTPAIRYGIEWGSCSTIFMAKHQNYMVEDGYRVDENHSEWSFIGNGQLLANVGASITPHVALAVYSGLTGISTGFRAIPLTLRGTYFFKDIYHDGALCYLDGGVGFKNYRNLSDVCTLFSAGTGYHMALNHSVSLDFLVSARLSFDTPDIIDPDSGKPIPAESIRVNIAQYGALNFSIALSF